MIEIDGSQGEGGGQILRSALALSLVTGEAFRMERIRAQRAKPGLGMQHLTAVLAAAEVGQADIIGADRGSQQLTFRPHSVKPGEYRFDVGTAGSVTLVLQTVLPALMTAEAPSQLTLEGGTHNPWVPPAEFLQRAFLPLLGRMGPRVEATLERAGFYPAGGGRLRVMVVPSQKLSRLDLPERGNIRQITGRAIVARLSLSIAKREAHALAKLLSWPEECFQAERVESAGPGNAVFVEVESEYVAEVFTAFGRKGVLAELVAHEAVEQSRNYLKAGAPVGEYLADQLLLPMALAGGGSFRTLAISSHTRTNIEVLQRFLPVEIACRQIGGELWEIAVQG